MQNKSRINIALLRYCVKQSIVAKIGIISAETMILMHKHERRYCILISIHCIVCSNSIT